MKGFTPDLQHLIIIGLLVLTRLSLMLSSMPAVGSGVPRRIRGLFAMALTVLLIPLTMHHPTAHLTTMVQLAIALAREALIGLMMGMVIQLLISGLQIAGELANSTGGLQLGDAYDPQLRATVPVFSKLVGMLAAAVLLVGGGHREMLDALMGSFSTLPPGRLELQRDVLDLLVHELTSGLAAGIRAAAPLLTAVLLANLITGLISRTLPQLNLLAIGLNVNAITVLAVTALVIVGLAGLFDQEIVDSLSRLRTWIDLQTEQVTLLN